MSASISAVSVAADDIESAQAFYSALGLSDRVRLHAADEPSEGFRGFTLSPLVADPRQVDAFLESAARAGGRTITPARKSLWGYGGSVQAPDGSVWTVASSSKKPTGDAAPPLEYDSLVLLLGVDDVKTSKQFYVEQGLPVGKGTRYWWWAATIDDSPAQVELHWCGACRHAFITSGGLNEHRTRVHD